MFVRAYLDVELPSLKIQSKKSKFTLVCDATPCSLMGIVHSIYICVPDFTASHITRISFRVDRNDNINFLINTGLFISPSGISELNCATTKTDRQKGAYQEVEKLSKFFFVLGALAYFQVPPLGGSREEKWHSQ